ncbi:sulfur carrier protein ThiS [Shimia sp.]|uniref:sulfur carrier protein ThiS n=1 Tax=Shimia sp. TaxID=1954381 RepID=UPI0032975C0E
MKIIVNAVPHEVTSRIMSVALSELGFTSNAMATALNGRFIPNMARETTALTEGDKLEILAPMQGG